MSQFQFCDEDPRAATASPPASAPVSTILGDQPRENIMMALDVHLIVKKIKTLFGCKNLGSLSRRGWLK